MTKVYVLSGGCIGDRYVIGVFSSMKRAVAVRKSIIQKESYYRSHPEDLTVDIYELNKYAEW